MSATSPYAEQLGRFTVVSSEITVNGAPTRYWEYVDEWDGENGTIILVHGFRGDHHGLEPVVAQLAGYRIISPDLPGFGESGPFPIGEHTIEAYASWLQSFVARLEFAERPVILGHSFGSIVVSAAMASGMSASRVILVNPIAAPALQGPRGVLTRLAVFYYWAASALPAKAGFALLRNPLIVRIMSLAMVKTKDPTLRAFVHDQHDRYFSVFSDRDTLMQAFQASVSHDVSEYAARIAEPTQLIAAEKDDITSVSAQRELVKLFPDARLEIIPKVGHLIHYETPREAAEFIRDFLGR